MFRLDGRGRLPALILSGGLAATLGLTAAPPAQAATALGTVTFAAARGALAVTGTPSADTIAFTRSSSDADIGLNRWGAITGAWIGFTLVPQGKNLSDPAAKGVCVSSGGRVRVISDPPCTAG